MKTSIEIPDTLFRLAKARAAMEGMSLRDLFLRGLQLYLTSSTSSVRKRAHFPLFHATHARPPLTDEQVYSALNIDEEIA